MRTVLTFAVFLLLFFGCSKEQSDHKQEEKVDFTETLNPEQIDDAIYAHIKKEQKVYNWENATLHLLWSAVKHGNDLVSIGYGENNDDSEKSLSKNASQMESDLLKLIAELEDTNVDKILDYKSELCNNFIVKIKDARTLLKLRNHQHVRYVEPIGYRMGKYEVETRLDAGCDDGKGVIQSDYKVDDNNNLIPWNWFHHNIIEAQKESYAKGKGIHISIIDTGLSPAQDALKSPEWTTCYSNGRSLSNPTFVDLITPGGNQTDMCGHGTAMAAIATAPMSCKGRIPGVAFRSTLKVYRAASDVVIDEQDAVKRVAKAFELSSKDPKGITSISMGRLTDVTSIADAIKLTDNRKRLIFAASGTTKNSLAWVPVVVFPASMDEVIAVTGIFPKRQDHSIERCKACHIGSQVDFAVVMEKNQDGSERYVPHVGHRSGERKLTGGTSAATATMAGMAAVIWSTNPSKTKDEVLKKLIAASQYAGNKHDKYGYGIVDALKAVRSMDQ